MHSVPGDSEGTGEVGEGGQWGERREEGGGRAGVGLAQGDSLGFCIFFF